MKLIRMFINKFGINKYFVKRFFNKHFPKVILKGDFNIGYFENIKIAGYCYIGPGAFWMAKGGIDIGNNVIFGPNCTIWTENHNYESVLALPYGGEKDNLHETVYIEDNVWVGLNVIILSGVRVGEGSVIGAGSVITKNVPSYAIVAGNPARVLKYRNIDIYNKLKGEKRFYLENLANNNGEL